MRRSLADSLAVHVSIGVEPVKEDVLSHTGQTADMTTRTLRRFADGGRVKNRSHLEDKRRDLLSKQNQV